MSLWREGSQIMVDDFSNDLIYLIQPTLQHTLLLNLQRTQRVARQIADEANQNRRKMQKALEVTDKNAAQANLAAGGAKSKRLY